MLDDILIPGDIAHRPLDPKLRQMIEARAGQPQNDERPLADARQAFIDMRQTAPHPDDGIIADERTIPGPAGAIPVRIYRQAATSGPVPILVYFHGGGFVIGNLDTHDAVCRAILRRTDLVIMSVDYRLAPEHPYPAALEDGTAALRFAADEGAALGGDPSRLALAGDSAGGMLAIVTALEALDAGAPKVRALMPFYPMTDLVDVGNWPSYAAHGDGRSGLSTRDMTWFVDCYCPDIGRRGERYASPVRVADLSGMPPTLVVVAEHDVLHDEADAFVHRLDAAGVPTTRIAVAGVNHGFMGTDLGLPEVAAAFDRAAAWLAGRLAG